MARLREAIVLRLRDPSLPDGELRQVLHEIAAEARANSLRPEVLIVTLKSMLSDVDTARSAREPDEQRRLQEWLVTTCIRAYFDQEQPGSAGPD